MTKEKLQWTSLVCQGESIIAAKMSLVAPHLGQVPDAIYMAKEAKKSGVNASWCAWENEATHVSVCVLFPPGETDRFPFALKRVPGWERPVKAWRWCSPAGGEFRGSITGLPLNSIDGLRSFYDKEVMVGVAGDRLFVASLSLPPGKGGHYTLVGYNLVARENIPLFAALVDRWLVQFPGKNEAWRVHLRTSDNALYISALRIVVGDIDHPDHLVVSGSLFVEVPTPTEEMISKGEEVVQLLTNNSIIQTNGTEPGKVFAFINALSNRPGISVTIEQRGEIFSCVVPLLYVAQRTIELYCQTTQKEPITFPGIGNDSGHCFESNKEIGSVCDRLVE